MPTHTTTRTNASEQQRLRSNLLQWTSAALLAIVVIIGLVIGLVVLIIWLIVRPKPLVYTIEDGLVQDLNVTNDHMNATFDFIIKSHNPNRMAAIYYDSIEVIVVYNHQTLGFNTLEPFYQPRRNDTLLEAKLEARDLVLSRSMSRSLRVETNSGQVTLDVSISARIRYNIGVIKTRDGHLKIYCSDVKANLNSSKTFERIYCGLDG